MRNLVHWVRIRHTILLISYLDHLAHYAGSDTVRSLFQHLLSFRVHLLLADFKSNDERTPAALRVASAFLAQLFELLFGLHNLLAGDCLLLKRSLLDFFDLFLQLLALKVVVTSHVNNLRILYVNDLLQLYLSCFPRLLSDTVQVSAVLDLEL